MASEGEDSQQGERAILALQRAAPVFLIATLIALFLAPLALGARVVNTSARLSEVDDATRLALNMLTLTAANEASAIRAYASMTSDGSRAPMARAYGEARAIQTRAFDQLVPLLPKLTEHTRSEVLAFAGALREWHQVHDELLAGNITSDEYAAQFGAQQELLDEALAHSRAAFDALNAETRALRERLSWLTQVQVGVTAGLAGLALGSILITLWLASRARLVDAARREQLVAEQLAGARADLLSWVSHDLKNPLAAIRMGCTNLRRTLVKNPARAPFIVDTIDRSALRMSRLIRNLLDSARLDAGRALVMDTRALDLSELAERTCEEAEQLTGGEVEIHCTVGPDLPPVRGDRLRLEQALLNLLQNAVRASEGEGSVEVSATREDGFVKVAVQDHGGGIPDELLPRLFTPFRAAQRSDSTGLGLSIVKAVVEAHGGEVSLETQPGEGTTFYFRIPTASDDDNREAKSA